MKVSFRVLAVMTLALALAALVMAFVSPQPNVNDRSVTLTGTISDSMCGAKHMMSGDESRCVRTCVKNGSQYVLILDQKVYPLNGRSEELDKRAGQRVIVTGTLGATGLQVASVKIADTTLPAQNRSSGDTASPAETITIEGLVRDIACPIQNKAASATVFNLKCAQECARLGSPLIVLTNDGVLYTPISAEMPDKSQRQRLMPFLGKYVRVTGQIFERAGTHAIVIKEIHEMRNVHLITNAE
jgi:hypothetical protein